jgi:hypothetical protein
LLAVIDHGLAGDRESDDPSPRAPDQLALDHRPVLPANLGVEHVAQCLGYRLAERIVERLDPSVRRGCVGVAVGRVRDHVVRVRRARCPEHDDETGERNDRAEDPHAARA